MFTLYINYYITNIHIKEYSKFEFVGIPVSMKLHGIP